MLKETIKYEDYNGEQRETVEYFHLTEKEIVDLQAHSENGIQQDIEEAIKSNDVARVLDYITNLVEKSYGRKTKDGKQFVKNPEILAEFTNSAFYSDFLMGLIQNDGIKGQEFIKGIMPKKLVDRAMAQSQGQETAPTSRETFESTVYAPSVRETFAARQDELRQPEAPSTFEPREVAPAPVQAAPSPLEDPEYQAYLAEKRRRQELEGEFVHTRPEHGFRVRADEEADLSLPRPPHEQNQANPQQ